jgi:hypothetical protein
MFEKTYLILILMLCGFSANAQQNYDASLIPKELLPYASSVIRNQEISVNVKDLDNMVYHFKQAITILNKNGDDDAQIEVWHNKSISVKYIKGTVYNEFGKPVSKFSESAFDDANAQNEETIFDDDKVSHYKPTSTTYPYTVEYEYETRSKETLNLNEWDPNPGTGIAVEKSSYTFNCKPDFDLRYKEINMPSGVTISTNKDGLKTYAWQINNLKAIKYEPYHPNADKYLSIVKLSPVKFSYGGMTGSYTSWNELGKWISDHLLVNRQAISPETITEVQQLTAGISEPKLKAKKIYEYMQNKTHYVNTVIGIGGFQPIAAAEVDKLNYGDCKALVNYAQALLNAVNIDSYYCIVMADHSRKFSLLSDFPSMDQANHIILCIPFKNDTTWCDCTSQTIPFGYIGDFTDDRTVLACTPAGGKLMQTPKYTAENNLKYRKADFILNSDGDLSGNMTTTFAGVNYTDREWVNLQSPTDQQKAMQRIYPINNMDIEKLEITQDKSLKPVTTEKIELIAHEYAAVNGDKINFLLNIANRLREAPRNVLNRKTDVYINEGYTEKDEVTYTLPAGYREDNEPLNVSIRKPFGTFNATSTMKDGKLIFKRRLQLLDGTYSKETYSALVDFFQQVVDADSQNVTLVKITN